MALYDYKGNDLTKKLITGKMSYEDWEKLITRQMEEAIYKEVKKNWNKIHQVQKSLSYGMKMENLNTMDTIIRLIMLLKHYSNISIKFKIK